MSLPEALAAAALVLGVAFDPRDHVAAHAAEPDEADLSHGAPA